jgi:hypothetical protein
MGIEFHPGRNLWMEHGFAQRKRRTLMAKVEREDFRKNQESRSLTDEQIITEKSLPRRSFLATTGAVLVGGAAALVLGRSAVAQSQDPDKPRTDDPDKAKDTPDKAKAQDPDKGKSQHPHKAQDPDKAKAQHPDKAQDPDKAKAPDPDKVKPQDPDKAKPPDPH